MPRNKKNITARVSQVIDAYHSVGEDTDVLGSYTGIPAQAQMLIDPADPKGTKYRPLSKTEKEEFTPVQDADDL